MRIELPRASEAMLVKRRTSIEARPTDAIDRNCSVATLLTIDVKEIYRYNNHLGDRDAYA